MQTELDTEIGTKDQKKLEPKKVIVLDVTVEMQKDRDKKEVGKKVILTCKHPDKEDPIKISTIVYIKNKEIKSSGIWFQLDEDHKLGKETALAAMLRFYQVKNLSGMIKLEISTELDERGYLCVKAY